MNTDWQLDEMAHAGHEHLDPNFVANFDRKQNFDPAQDVDVLRRHGLGADSTLLDLAAGTGKLAVAAAPYCRRVIAVDVSPPMRRAIEQRVAAAQVTNVEVVQAGFLTYEHQGPPAHAVYTRNALHQIPDFWKVLALRRITGWLRRGGVLCLRDLIFDTTADDIERVIGAWFARAATDPKQGYTAEDFAEHMRAEHSTFRWLFELMLDATGFDVLDVDYRAQVYAAYTCRRR
ncbi:MAG TPA: class I SAM-dependent methyltransferase [Dehalococcoidia bacterium]|nr:class I SAM-dependent methyltransferase [Dehalococcoidia bacterium]